ncbi:MAG: protoheme IX farnesyltransferase, partial [Chloroflexi bacterium]|nr:protoheme IX farnesyltransferase [Chloroflexota bacterium]
MLGSVAARRARTASEVAVAYLRLTKPRIILLLLITTIPAMILAEGGWPSPWLVLATLAGGAMAAGGANALNCYFDRDIDSMMLRTRGRPVPAGQIEPERAALFGVVLAGAGFLILEAFVNLPAAFLTLGAFGFYVVVYTILLKRSTPLNIVIGGAAGAMPPVVGWAAVTGRVELPALILFGIVVLWTPPHFWALALNYSSDYRRARVPMLPVVLGEEETRRQI